MSKLYISRTCHHSEIEAKPLHDSFRYPQTLPNVCLEIYNISLTVTTQFSNCETSKLHGRYDNG